MSFFAVLGILGILGMTWFFPLVARVLAKPRRSLTTEENLYLSAFRGVLHPIEVAVLIPAHNDEKGLERTLHSVLQAARVARETFPSFSVKIWVGLDGCTDNSKIIASMCGAQVISSEHARGKWRTINELIAQVPSAQWVALADCGIVWDEDFFMNVLPSCYNPAIMGLAPTYRNARGGVLERIVWSVERHFKTLEDTLGGPISIHGATVMYRNAELTGALSALKSGRWLNDDVVLPLVMRGLNPTLAIRYLPNVVVYDSGDEPAKRQFTRRRRLVLGNVQWIRSLLPNTWNSSAAVGTMALRRVFRMFWAYWFLLLGVSIVGYLVELAITFPAITLPAVGLAAFVGTACIFRFVSLRLALRAIVDSAMASFLAPFYLVNAKTAEGARWK